MLLYLLAIALLAVSPCLSITDLDGDSNIYEHVVNSMRQLKLRQHQGPPVQQAPSVCYEDLGCFERNGTFKHLKQLPDPPEAVGTQFHLYTRKNPWEAQMIDYKVPETVFNSNIDRTLPLKIITHGFGGRNNLTWVWNMKNAFLKTENVNIIVVDWSLGARVPFYIQAAVNAELVGAHTAVMYYFLKDNLGIMEKDLHVIGFSLGAQVSGFIGKRMMKLRGTRPARITGLDAAGPLFEDYGGEVHLYRDDADFVDVVHTNADLLIYGGVGMGKEIGHVDHYPNGGKRQPGCGSTIKGAFLDIFKGERERACNHERAVHLFTETILNPTSCKFTSYPCANYSEFEAGKCLSCDGKEACGQMGYKGHGTGVYYLMTKGKEPFCADPAKVTVRFSKGIKKSYGRIILTLIGGDDSRENITLTAKDEKLMEGEERNQVVAISNSMTPLKGIEALYLKYNGWIAKGTPTYSLESVTLKNANGKAIFNTCQGDVELNDEVPTQLKHCDA